MSDQTRLCDANGNILARDNFILAFFGCRPFREMAGDAQALVEQWLTIVPKDSVRWAVVGRNSSKYVKLTTQALRRCFDLLEEDVAASTDVFFEILGPESMGPDFGALVKGYAKPRKVGFADQTNVVQFLFPVDFCANFGEDGFAELMASMFERLDCDSAYAAPALHFGIIGRYDEARTFIAPRALQHHGYDVPNNATTASGLGQRARGARWLTALSSSMVDRAGGMKRLTKHVVRGVEIRELKNGVLIRAGATPELGAVNRAEGTPLLASVAHAIEPITHFGDNAILPLFATREQRDRWERRFWWNQD